MKPFFWYRCTKSLMLAIPQLEKLCPRLGTIGDLGCGNGYITHYLARHSAQRRMIGYDWYAERVAKAARLPPLPNCQFRIGDLLTAVATIESVDHFVCIDVLYLLPPFEQDTLLRRCYDRLPAGGTLTLKYNDTSPRWKYAWARFQEQVAVHAFRISRSTHPTFYFRSTADYVATLTRIGFHVVTHRIDRWRPYPDVVCVATKGNPAHA